MNLRCVFKRPLADCIKEEMHDKRLLADGIKEFILKF